MTPAMRRWLRRKAASIFDASGWTDGGELSVLLTGDAEIAELNATWRGVDRPTDVLAFAMRDAAELRGDAALLGDIVVSVETAARQVSRAEHARRVGQEHAPMRWELRDELLFLLVHGFLHLIGHDHDTEAREREMIVREREIFERLRGRSRKIDAAAPRPRVG